MKGSGSKIRSDKGFRIIWKSLLWIISSVVFLIGIAAFILYLWITPKHIINLIEEKSSEYLHAKIEIGDLDYTIWHTFPWISIEVDSLKVISKSLANLNDDDKRVIPADADLLVSVKRFKAKINLKELLDDELELKDIEIEAPTINIVIVNDSLNNFSIMPPMKEKIKMPELDIKNIKLVPPLSASICYIPENIEVETIVDNFYFNKEDKKNYAFGMNAEIEGHYGEISTPGAIPVELAAKAKLNLPEIILDLEKLSVNLADIGLNFTGNFIGSPSKIDIENLDIDINVPDIFTLSSLLLPFLSEKITLPDGLTGLIPLSLSIDLSEPYSLNLRNLNLLNNMQDLPPFAVNIDISDGNIHFRPAGEKPLVADDISLDADLNFNPRMEDANHLQISELKMNGEGVNINGELYIDNLLGDSQKFKGNVRFGSSLLKTLSYLLPVQFIKIAGHINGDLIFSGVADNYGKSGIRNIKISAKAKSKQLKVNESGNSGGIDLGGMKADLRASIPKYPMNNYQGVNLKFDFSTDSIISKITAQNKAKIRGLDFNLNIADTVKGGKNPDGKINISLQEADYENDGILFDSKKINISAKGHLLSKPKKEAAPFTEISSPESNLIAERITHTPLFLQNSGGGMMQTMISLLSLDADVKMEEAFFKTDAYLYPVKLLNADLSTDLNKFSFSVDNLQIGKTSLGLSGFTDGIGDFLTSYSPVLIKADADFEFKDVDINDLSWGYYGALLQQGKDSVFFIPPLKPFTAQDSTCIIIPRNIDANIRLKAKEARYMGYQFSPLSTAIIVKNGEAKLERLTIGTPYCNVAVDWIFSTKQLDNIYMDLTANLSQFSFQPFFRVFPQLIEKAQQLENLSGEISSDINCRFLMYPTMFMNPQSLKATFNLMGRGIEFARHGKIKDITHLLFIPGEEPISLENLDITGAFHDDFLQLNPFKIRFDDYQIGVAGVTNTEGGIYYHIALEKSPFHLPFGVNLEGTFKHHEIRLGGTHIDEKKTEKISEGIEWNPDINIMASLKNGWLMFVQEAAKYEGKLKEKRK